MTRTVVALFDDFQTANQAVRELKDHGFTGEDISLMANDTAGEYGRMLHTGSSVDRDLQPGVVEGSGTAEGASVGAGIGAVLGGLGGLLVGLGALTIPGIGPVIAAGPLAAALTGLAGAGVGAVAGGVTGGLLGALVDMGVPEDTAQYYAEGVRRGGTLLTIRTQDDRTNLAVDILNRHNPVDINQRVTQWRDAGWTGFDVNAPNYPYNPTGIRAQEELEHREGLDRTGSHADTSLPSDRTGTVGYTGSGLGTGSMGTTGTGTTGMGTTGTGMGGTSRGGGMVYSRDTDTTNDMSQSHDPNWPRGSYHPEEGGKNPSETYSENRPGLYKPEEGGNATLNDTVHHHTDFTEYDHRFRDHFQTTFSATGGTYDVYMPAYRYGYELANDNRYRGYDWDRLEPEARRYWDERNPGSWDRFKMAVRHAWEEIKDAVD